MSHIFYQTPLVYSVICIGNVENCNLFLLEILVVRKCCSEKLNKLNREILPPPDGVSEAPSCLSC